MTVELDTYNIRSRILMELGRRCQWLLTKDLGLEFTAASVYWARQQLTPEELPAAVITPSPEAAARSYGVDTLTWPITISLACLLGSRAPLDFSEHLLAELRRKIPLTDPTMGGLADDLRYVQGGVEDYPERDNQALVVAATFEIDYTTQANNPDENA